MFLCVCSYLECHLFHLDIWFGNISIFFDRINTILLIYSCSIAIYIWFQKEVNAGMCELLIMNLHE